MVRRGGASCLLLLMPQKCREIPHDFSRWNQILLDFLDIYSTPDDFLCEFHIHFFQLGFLNQPSTIWDFMTPNGFYGLSIRMQRSNRTEVSSCHIYWISTEKHWISSVNSRRLIRLISEMAEVTAPFRPFRSSLVALASHLLAANGTHQCWTSLLGATFFTEIQVQGEASFKLYPCFMWYIIPWSIMWFKKEYFEAPSKSITRKMRQLEYVFHPIPTLLANFERQLIGANLMGLRPWKSLKVGLLRRWIATLPTFQVILRLEMDNWARCQCEHTFNDIRLYMTWRLPNTCTIMLHLPNVTGTFSPAVCVGLDYLDWQGESGCHKPCCLHILQLKMGRMRQHPQDLGRPVAHCWQESDKWRTNFGILQLVY